MIQKVKKIFFILVAIFCGALIVFVALKWGSIFDGSTMSFRAPIKKVIDNSWKDSLSVIPGDGTGALVEKGVVAGSDSVFTGTATADITSRKLLTEYATFRKNNKSFGSTTAPLSEAEAERMATRISQDIKLPNKTLYTLRDITIVDDKNPTVFKVYADTLKKILNRFVDEQKGKETVLDIVSSSMTAKDPKGLERLDIKITQYQKLETDLLALKTPQAIASIHLHLVQTYADIRSAIEGFKVIFSDPAIGIVAIGEFKNGIEKLNTISLEYKNFKI